MNRLELFHRLDQFQGRRNTLLTIIIPPFKNVNEVIGTLEQRVRAIRHANKRSQILQVFSLIHKSRIDKPSQYTQKGVFICAGYNLQKESLYAEFKPFAEIKEQEYYYDYGFNMSRIRELLWNDVYLQLSPKELEDHQSSVKEAIRLGSPKLVIGREEVNESVENGTLRYLYTLYEFTPEELNQFVHAGVKVVKMELDIPFCGMKW